MTTVTIARFELYPPTAPTAHVVGFAATCNTFTKYADTMVPRVGNQTDAEIIAAAWDALKAEFAAWETSVATQSPLVGSVYDLAPPPVLSLDDAKAAVLARLADIRFATECGGLTVVGLGTLPTDRGSQAMLASALQFLALAPDTTTVPWKLSTGDFVSLTLDHLRTIARLVGDHVLGCFRAEALLAARVRAAGSTDDLEAISLEDGWPLGVLTLPTPLGVPTAGAVVDAPVEAPVDDPEVPESTADDPAVPTVPVDDPAVPEAVL